MGSNRLNTWVKETCYRCSLNCFGGLAAQYMISILTACVSTPPLYPFVTGQWMKTTVVPKPYSYYLKVFDKPAASIAKNSDPDGFHPAITGILHST